MDEKLMKWWFLSIFKTYTLVSFDPGIRFTTSWPLFRISLTRWTRWTWSRRLILSRNWSILRLTHFGST
jgi:hypothetical protein